MSIDRRALFVSTGATLFLAACGPAGTAAPRRGSTLRAVFTGGGAAESLDPFGGGSPVDFVRSDVLYDSLFVLRAGEVAPALATSAEPAADARSFVVRLRQDVLWHDGSPFTAEDVAFSLRYMSSPDRPYPSQLSAYLDVKGLKVRDRHTVEIPTLQPVGDPALFLAAFPGKMVKEHAAGVGTGPYRVTAFEPGREARLARFERHWGGAAPMDELVLISLTDPQAKVNAVASGQADYAGDIPFTAAKTGVPAGFEVRTAGVAARNAFGFVLNATREPFDDPRARKAVRLAVDRQALVDTVLLGYGTQGNDLLCAGAKYHDGRPAPARDLDQARRLLREAGAEGRRITIRSAEWEIGYNASTQLLAEQLKEIGLDARPQIVSPPEFFEMKAVAAANAVAFSAGPVPLAVIYARLAAIPALAMPDKDFQALLAEGVGATGEAQRVRAWADLQEAMAERGNTIVWGQADVLSLARRNVGGIEVRDQPKYPYLGKAGLA